SASPKSQLLRVSSLIREIDPTFDITGLINFYIEQNVAGKTHWDLSEYYLESEVIDQEVRLAFSKKLNSFPEDREIEKILINLGRDNGWNPDDLRFLANHNATDYFNVFKKLRDEDLKWAVRGGLKFAGVFESTEEMVKISNDVQTALRQIASESNLNRRRVLQKGLKLPPTAPPP
ncbi:hypothetical protein, partial [Aquidulcibacter paucihalophilus]|uniref:hypothetical protein n=1 Tax=Aquidulcibacter paucihalophilus TaxID=1978549 RepID=UPI0012FF97DC